MIEEYQKDLYFVAVKVFVTNSKGELLITKDKFGDWDLPGGRLRSNDFNTSLENVIKRKFKEELGAKFKYQLSSTNIYMRHERNEIFPIGKREKRRIFAIAYKAKHLGGEISLGENHIEYKWEPLNTLKPQKYFSGGWLKGVKEYIKLYIND